MNVLKSLKTDKTKNIQGETDRLGGFSVLETDVYGFTIKAAYITFANSNAMAINVHFEGPNGENFRESWYVTSGEAKGCSNTYVKDGKEFYLPGFNMANALCLLTLGKELGDMEPEKKYIKLRNYETKKDEDTEVDMLTELIDQRIIVAVQKQIVDKRRKSEATGEYEPTGETREVNETVKLFHPESQLTISEIDEGVESPEFLTKWLEMNKGKTRDRSTKGVQPQAGGASAQKPTGAAAGTPKLFGAKK